MKISVSCCFKWNNTYILEQYSFHTILKSILNIIGRLINAESRRSAPVMS